LSDWLNEASTRISTVGRAYERLAYNADYESIGLVSYLREVIGDLETAVAPCKVQLEAPEEIQFTADRAILVALVINELVLNAGKTRVPKFFRRIDLGKSCSNGKGHRSNICS
jgi:two-component sensor histidine kinase